MSKLIVKGEQPSDFRWKDRKSITNNEFQLCSKSVSTIYILEYEINIDKMNELYGHKDDYKELSYEDRFSRFAYFFENDARQRAIELIDFIGDRLLDGIRITKCDLFAETSLAEYPRIGQRKDKYLSLLEGGTCYHNDDEYKELRDSYEHLTGKKEEIRCSK